MDINPLEIIRGVGEKLTGSCIGLLRQKDLN